jgi:hypothetical protein
MKVMNFRSWVKTIKESVKDDELNRILDKISKEEGLTDFERRFLNNYNSSSEDDYKDFLCLTKNDVFNRVRDLLEERRKVICDMYDKNGKIGLDIVSIHNDFDEDFCYIVLKNNDRITLRDNYLYNIIYDLKRDEYSLQTEEEFYEKIPVKDEN